MDIWYYDEPIQIHPHLEDVIWVCRNYCFSFRLFSDEDWKFLGDAYAQLPGYMGKGITPLTRNFPYWFGKETDDELAFNELWEGGYDEIHLSVSVEPGGLQVSGILRFDDWIAWTQAFEKLTASLPHYPG